MGFIIKDNGKGVHAEARRESFVIFTDHGDKRIELSWNQLEELKLLLQRLEEHNK